MKKNKLYAWTLAAVVLSVIACVVLCFFDGGQSKSTTGNGIDPNGTPIATVEKPDTSLYEIIAIKQNQAAQIFYVLYKPKKFDEKSLNEFVTKFKTVFCNTTYKIDLYDIKSLRDIMIKDSLSNEEYLQLADHTIASLTFEMKKVCMYPLQNIKYKELGGRNWKKEHNF